MQKKKKKKKKKNKEKKKKTKTKTKTNTKTNQWDHAIGQWAECRCRPSRPWCWQSSETQDQDNRKVQRRRAKSFGSACMIFCGN